MNYAKQLLKSEICALIALVAVALLVALLFAVTDKQNGGVLTVAGFCLTLAYGCLPVVFYGAPIHAYLCISGKPTWVSAILVGIGPAALFLYVDVFMGVMALVCGALVAAGTHLLHFNFAEE